MKKNLHLLRTSICCGLLLATSTSHAVLSGGMVALHISTRFSSSIPSSGHAAAAVAGTPALAPKVVLEVTSAEDKAEDPSTPETGMLVPKEISAIEREITKIKEKIRDLKTDTWVPFRDTRINKQRKKLRLLTELRLKEC